MTLRDVQALRDDPTRLTLESFGEDAAVDLDIGGEDLDIVGELETPKPPNRHASKSDCEPKQKPKCPLLPFGAIVGARGVPAVSVASAALMRSEFQAAIARPGGSKEGGFLLQEGAKRDDIFGFSVVGETFQSAYTVEKQIGEGGFGKVYLARHKVLGIARAVKRLKKTASTNDMRINELAALRALDHPHIIKLVEYYDSEDNFLYLVFELCEGPDLLEHLRQQADGRMNEYDATVALRHILKALQCCHAQHRGHYDIKPENFMYVDTDRTNLKMIDLGLSSGFDRRRRGGVSGTFGYMAPEFWNGVYGPEGDVWSCGIVLFVMLTGEDFLTDEISPENLRRETMMRAPLKKRLSDVAAKYKLSNNAMDLLGWMLQHDRHARPTVRDCLNHALIQHFYALEKDQPWFRERPNVTEAITIRERLPETLRAVGKEPMLKRVARQIFAHDACGKTCIAERIAYQMLDSYGYGEISIGVLEKDFLKRGADTPEDIEELFDAIDLNRDGYIGTLAFLSATLPAAVCNDENLCRVAFAMLDRGKDGFIDAEDLENTFGHERGSPICKGALLDVCDDGWLSFEQFVQLMHMEPLSLSARLEPSGQRKLHSDGSFGSARGTPLSPLRGTPNARHSSALFGLHSG